VIETEKIKERRKTPEARKAHDFEAAKWTHPNGHPRCALCGDEEPISERCPGADHDGLNKGAMQRQARFNPLHDVPKQEHETIRQWQEYEKPKGGGSWAEADPSEHRENIEEMHPAAHQRALHKLSSMTQVRKNPHSGEREFLLHRGMSPDEHITSVSGGRVSSHVRTSWTPDHDTAKTFTRGQTVNAFAPKSAQHQWDTGHLVSAWIPESQIHHMPMMYGSKPDWSQRAGKKHLSNIMGKEGEVIVKPNHNSEHVPQENIPAPKPIHTTITQAQPERILGEQFARRAFGTSQAKAIASLPKSKQSTVKAKLSQGKSKGKAKPVTMKEIVAKIKQFGKSEDLAKGQEGDWKKQGYSLRYHKPGQYERNPKQVMPTWNPEYHMVTAHDLSGKRVGHLSAEDTGDGKFQPIMVEVHPKHQRRGIASSMYRLMETSTKLKASPDLESQSPAAQKLWAQPKRPFGKPTGRT
jgi:hypothetical protein